MTTSLALNNQDWDLTLNASGNLALVKDTQATLQDVCSAVQTWLGEAWYDLTLGLPYDTSILGGSGTLQSYASFAEEAARAVPNVADVKCVLTQLKTDRRLGGKIAILTDSGETISAEL